MRSFIAVVAPWLLWGVVDNAAALGLASALPDAFDAAGYPVTTGMLAALLILRAGYSAAAGWLSAKFSCRNPKAVRACVALLLLTGVLVQIATADGYPPWYHAIFIVSIVPCALFGASRVKGSA